MGQDIEWHDEVPTTLRTARLRLDALREDDAPVLAALMQREREHLAPWIGIPGTEADARARIRELEARLRYLVRRPDDGAPIGCVGLDAQPAHRALALTYWFAAAHTGHGYATEASVALVDLAIRASNVEHFEIWCHVDNAPSAGVARSLGFARAASLKDLHVWVARPVEHRAWQHVRDVAAQLGHVEVNGDAGLLRMRTDHGELQLAVTTVAGEPYVSVAAFIGPDSLYPARASLAHNATLAVGSLVIDRGVLQLRYASAPLGITRGCLALLLHEAFRLRRLATARPQVIHLDAFANAF